MGRNALPYYPRYPRDFFEGTADMPFELKAAYGLVIDLIFMSGDRGLPDNPHYIAGQLGCSVRKWNILRRKLIEMGKLYAENEIISNKTADNLKIIQRSKQDKNAEIARDRWKNKDLADANASADGYANQNQNQKEVVVDAREADQSEVSRTEMTAEEVDALYSDVMALSGVAKNGRIPTYWMPPEAPLYISKWVTDLGLTPVEIRRIVRETRKNWPDPPNGPKAYERAMQRYAETRDSTIEKKPSAPRTSGPRRNWGEESREERISRWNAISRKHAT